MIFRVLNREKIQHEPLTDLSILPVRGSHFTLGNPKKSFKEKTYWDTMVTVSVWW